jgi:hypothetical protein
MTEERSAGSPVDQHRAYVRAIGRWLPEILCISSPVLFVPAVFAAVFILEILDIRAGVHDAAAIAILGAAGFSVVLQIAALLASLATIKKRRVEGGGRWVSALVVLVLSTVILIGVGLLVALSAWQEARWEKANALAELSPPPRPAFVVELRIVSASSAGKGKAVFQLGKRQYRSAAQLTAALTRMRKDHPDMGVRIVSPDQAGFDDILKVMDACTRADVVLVHTETAGEGTGRDRSGQ